MLKLKTKKIMTNLDIMVTAIRCIGDAISETPNVPKNYEDKNFLTFDEWKLIKAMEENVSTN